MTTQKIQATQKKNIAAPFMNLDVGRLTALEAIQVGGLAVASLAVAALGGCIAYAALPDYYQQFNGWRLLFFTFGATLGLVAFFLGAVSVGLSVRSWLRYEARLQDWHDVAIEAYADVDGIETEQTVTVWELSANNPLHVLGVALAHHLEVGGGQAAPTVRGLQGDRWLAGPGGRMINLGQVNSTQAARLPDVYVQLGLIDGRAPRVPGTWNADTADDVIQKVITNWHKVKV